MEKRGLGTKATRASIIDTLYQRKYLKNDPVEPSQLGMAIIDALMQFVPRITTSNMTAELEEDMTKVSEGKDTRDGVVTHSRTLLADMIDTLIEHKEDLSEAIADAVTADAKVGVCPKCGKDLVVKTSAKTRGSFVGCMGWPDCDVTYPLPQGRIEPLEGEAGYVLSAVLRVSRYSRFVNVHMRCASIPLVLQMQSPTLSWASVPSARQLENTEIS